MNQAVASQAEPGPSAPNFVAIYDVGMQDGQPFLVSAWQAGKAQNGPCHVVLKDG